MHLYRRRFDLVLYGLTALVTFAGCDSPAEPSDDPGIAVIAKPAGDTIDGIPAQGLVVQVRNANGALASGTTVRFESTTRDDVGFWATTVSVSQIAGTDFRNFAAANTDGQGRAVIRVRMGQFAGEGGVVVTVPEFGYVDTVSFTINVGRAHGLQISPSDTAVAIGRSFSPRLIVVDRYGNERPDATTLTLVSGPVTVNGASVTGNAFGRARLAVRFGSMTDTLRVSVVPNGTIAAWTMDGNQQLGIYTLELDGTGIRRVITSNIFAGYNGDMPMAWTADGSRIVYHDPHSDHTRKLYIGDVATGQTQRLVATTEQLEFEGWPQISADGDWIYYNGGTYWAQSAHRVRTNGTGRERLNFTNALDPAPSPDGTRVVAANTGAQLQVLTLATGNVVTLPATGLMPVWTPDGQEIIYVATADTWTRAGTLRAIRPDGTGDRAVTTGNVRVQHRFSFSPDGRYLIARGDYPYLVLVDFATGESVNIRYRSFDIGFFSPAWRR